MPGNEIDADLLVAGILKCNGYAEVYYEAEITCYSRHEAVCTLIERPPGGDRPGNLAIEVVATLNAKLDALFRRSERARAISELRGLEPEHLAELKWHFDSARCLERLLGEKLSGPLTCTFRSGKEQSSAPQSDLFG